MTPSLESWIRQNQCLRLLGQGSGDTDAHGELAGSGARAGGALFRLGRSRSADRSRIAPSRCWMTCKRELTRPRSSTSSSTSRRPGLDTSTRCRWRSTRRGGRVARVGCSPGHLAMALVKAGFEVQGIDLNALWLAKYAPGWPERLRITHTNIEQDPMPFPSESFDLVIFTEVLEHIAITDPCVDSWRNPPRPSSRRPDAAVDAQRRQPQQRRRVDSRRERVLAAGDLLRKRRSAQPRIRAVPSCCSCVERAGFAQHALGYMNTWSNWNHTTAPLFHRMLDGSERAKRIGRHPLFNNTIFVVATR